VVQSELRPLQVACGQGIAGDRLGAEELLHANDRFQPAEPGIASGKMRKTIACLDPVTVPAIGMRPLALDFDRSRVGTPRQIALRRVLSALFKRPPVGSAKLEARPRQKNSDPSARSAL